MAQVGGEEPRVRDGRGAAVTPRAAATVAVTSAGSASGARSTQTAPSAKCVGDVVRDGQGQPRLAHPAGTGQGQQGHGLVEQERPRRGSLVVATDEPGAGDRQGR